MKKGKNEMKKGGKNLNCDVLTYLRERETERERERVRVRESGEEREREREREV